MVRYYLPWYRGPAVAAYLPWLYGRSGTCCLLIFLERLLMMMMVMSWPYIIN